MPSSRPRAPGRRSGCRSPALIEKVRFAPDSPLEGDGFELPVPRAMQARLEAKIAGFGCVRRRLSAAAVGGHQLMRKAKSRNRTLIARGTGSSNPSPSSGESSANLIFGAASRRRGCRAPSIILSAPASSPAIRALRSSARPGYDSGCQLYRLRCGQPPRAIVDTKPDGDSG